MPRILIRGVHFAMFISMTSLFPVWQLTETPGVAPAEDYGYNTIQYNYLRPAAYAERALITNTSIHYPNFILNSPHIAPNYIRMS
jgi:hypothetical protein